MNNNISEILDNNKIKQLAMKKMFNMKNVVMGLALIIFAFVLIGAFNNNVLKPSESILRKQEVKNAILLIIPLTILEIGFIIGFYVKIKKYAKVLKGNYKCISTRICEKKEEHSTEQYNDGTSQSYSNYYVSLNGMKYDVEISYNEYKVLKENDKCYAIMVEDGSSEIKTNNIILVVKADRYEGENEVIELE